MGGWFDSQQLEASCAGEPMEEAAGSDRKEACGNGALACVDSAAARVDAARGTSGGTTGESVEEAAGSDSALACDATALAGADAAIGASGGKPAGTHFGRLGAAR